MEAAGGKPCGLAHRGTAQGVGVRTGVSGSRQPLDGVVFRQFGHVARLGRRHTAEQIVRTMQDIGAMQGAAFGKDRTGIDVSARSGSGRFEGARQEEKQHAKKILDPHRHLVYHITRREDTLFPAKKGINASKK